MDLGPDDIRKIITGLLVLVISIALHEFGHAFVATKLGDDTPRRQGRLTLNPLAHADPIGTFALPLMALLFTQGHSTGFGWGKPVQFQSHRFKRGISMRTGEMLVAIAGPFMNFLLGVVVAFVLAGLLANGVLDGRPAIVEALGNAMVLNFVLLFFNLIPAPPLDGGWVAQRFVPLKHRPAWEKYVVYAPFVIMAIVLIPVLAQIFTVPAMWLARNVFDLALMIFGM